jgi:hypothetical protein
MREKGSGADSFHRMLAVFVTHVMYSVSFIGAVHTLYLGHHTGPESINKVEPLR